MTAAAVPGAAAPPCEFGAPGQDPRVSRCSEVSRLVGDQLVGSAAARDHIFVEAPQPWPADWRRAPGYPDSLRRTLHRLTDRPGGNVKDHLILPDPAWSSPGLVRFMAYRLPGGPAARLVRHEYLAPADLIGAIAEAVLGGAGDLRPFAPYRSEPGEVRDIFVCTHGSRDLCCSRFGIPIYQALRKRAEQSGGRLRVWRTSHIGGHRFAPTLIEMPVGRYWGHLDRPMIDELADRATPPANLAAAYRGRALLPPLAQPVERALFLSHGWAWDDVAIEATIDVAGHTYDAGRQPATPVDRAVVTLAYPDPVRHVPAQVTAVVVADGTTPTAGCGSSISTVPRYRIATLR